MNYIILGAGGIGSYYGAKLLETGHNVIFIARGKHLKALKENGLNLSHPTFKFNKKVLAFSLDEIKLNNLPQIDAIILTTKSTTTNNVAKDLSKIFNDNQKCPFIVSLQNGVENEDILCNYFPKDKIIGALSRKIGAHIVKPGYIEATGIVETIIGTLEKTSSNKIFLQNFSSEIKKSGILCEVTDNIKLELWKKLIINNGVNAICALLEIKTGVLMHNKKLSQIVYGLMEETASAAKAVNIVIEKEDINLMFELIRNFDSIKPSMLIDKEFKRPLEIDEICGVVIKYNEMQGFDSPYTRTVASILEFTYNLK
ncbi:ketopantoate reductase family protein [Arcobacter sp. LA11]|uniref:ketopantoate reductase family protein n=1 Tax=Arcobacter sp. LA11 TaxID=1898176 RepID=UPI0009328C25|nr:ketopantoate reductase family protein [Arcobacter sp. LA11]